MDRSIACRRVRRSVAGLAASAVVVLSAVLTSGASAMQLGGASALPACTIVGTGNGETLRGTPGDDVICAVGGNDRVVGGRGDDTIFGSVGNDRLYGGPGNDRLYGFSGRDRLYGGGGNDLLQGAAGRDVLSGGRGTDTADYRLRRGRVRVSIGHGAHDGAPGEGDNVLANVENVRGGHGNDLLIGDAGRNRLLGGRGNDVLRGGRGNDHLSGGAGRDRLAARDGGRFVDRLNCGAGRGDLALADVPDHVASSCERVRRPHRHPNHRPSAITLTADHVAENLPAGTSVGTLAAVDRDHHQHHTFALVAGPGSADNGSFSVSGSTLKTAAVFDYEAKRSYSIRVRATDSGHPARSVEQTFTVSVTDVNESPTGIALTAATVDENQPAGTAVGTLSATDPDAGDHHAFTLVAGPGGADNGSFAIAGSTLKTAAAFDFETKRTYSIRVRATDSGGRTFEKVFTITVDDRNDAPTADPKLLGGVTEDGSKPVELSGSDQDGDPLTFHVTQPLHGHVDTTTPAATCDGSTPTTCTATVVYTPDADYNGGDSFGYEVNDGTSDSAAVTVTATVDPVNDAPVAHDGDVSVDEGTAKAVDLGALVSDVETSDAGLTYTIVSQPAHGHLTGSGPTATYVPDPGFNGSDSFTYNVTDGGDPDDCSGGAPACDAPRTSQTRTVTLTVAPVNASPVAHDATEHVSEDHPLAVDLTALASDAETTDPANLTYTIVDGPAHGTLSGSGPNQTYTPNQDYNGSDSFTYEVTDRGDPDNCGPAGPGCAAAKTSSPGTVSITIDPANDAPVADDGSLSVDEGQSGTVDLGALVSDVETGDAALTYVIVSQPAHGQLAASGTSETYTPDANFNGSDSFTYQVIDRGDPDGCSGGPPACDLPLSSQTKTIAITVGPVNDAPVAGDGLASATEDTPSAIDLSTLASDAETSPANLTYTILGGPAHGTLSGSGASRTYTPDPNYNGPDSFTYEVTDRGDPDNCGSAGPGCAAAKTSSPGTISITVAAANDAPVASDGSLSTDEDHPGTIDLGALVSDVETADANLDYVIVSGPVHGQLSASGTSQTYTPDPNFNGSDSFTYQVIDRGDPDGCSGGPPACDLPLSSQTKTISITAAPVNDAPVAGDGTASVDEDGATAVDLTALVSDVETSSANLTYAVVDGPTHGTLTGAGGSRTYAPDPDYNGPDSFTYAVTDRGDPDNCSTAPCDAPKTSETKTVFITVDAVNDAPVDTLPAGPLTAVQDTDTPVSGASISDVDAGNDDVQLTLSAVHGTLTVSTAAFGGVSPLQVVGNGTKTVVVTAGLLAINTTLAHANGLVYHGDAAYTGPDTLTVTTDDLGHNGSGGAQSDTDTLAISVVPPNQPPVANAQSVTTSEDTAKTITLSAGDPDGDDPLTFAIASNPVKGTVSSIGAVTCDHATPNTCSADVTYTPNANANGPDSFTFTANDGQVDSAAATVSIAITAVDDAPEITNLEGAALAYTENDPATAVTSSATVSDIDSPNFDTGTLTVDFSTGGTADDRLEIANQGTGSGQVGVSGSNVTFGGTTIGTFTGGAGTTPLVITLNNNADPTATQALVRAITYRNVSDDPATAARTVRFVLTDGDGGTSAAATRGIALTAVNDAPSLAGIEGSAVSYIESVDSAPSTSQITNALTVADPDDTDLARATVQITSACRSAEDVLTFSDQNGISGSYDASTCKLTLTGSASVANYQSALRSVQYKNTSDTPDTTTRTVSFQVDDGHAANHASNPQTRDVTVTASNDSPTGVNDTFNGTNSALAGVTLAVSTSPAGPNVSVTGNLLGNDTDPDTPHGNLTASAGTSSTQGGVVAVNSDGTFSYTPAPGFTGSDTFTYTVHDNDSPARTGTATVTINVAGPRVWFVNPGASGGDGTSRAPFGSLAPLSSGGGSDGLDGSGDVIFVYQGSGNAASSGFVLENDQRLVGQPQGLSVTNGNGTYNLVTSGGANPTITNGSGAGLTLADGNTIQRVNVNGASGPGVTGTGVNTLTYGANTTISGNAGGGLALSGAAGGTISVGAGITTSAGHSVAIANRTSGTTTLSGAIDDTGTGMTLTGNAGATIDVTGGVTASTGNNPAFTATGGGTIDVTGAANTLTTTTATALNVANTTIGAGGLTFKSISAGTASGSAGDGIFLNNTGSSGGLTVSGSGTAGSGGTIQHKTGADATTDGIGIYLNNTSSVSLARMQLNDFDNFAIRGTGVNGLTLSDSTINGSNGTSTAADEASLAFDNLTGSASITNDDISGGVEDDARIQNSTGSLNSLSITGSTFATTGAATANDALALLGRSGATVFNATVQNNTFTRAQGDLFQYTLVTGTGTLHFDSNTVTNNFPSTLPAGGGDINVSSASTASSTQSLQYSINNNHIYSSGTGGQPPNGSVIVVAATPQGSATGTIQNNLIGTTGITQSGGFDAILADAVKAGFHKVTITGNTIRRYKEAGIRLLGVSPAAPPGFNIRATVKGNTITEPDSVAFAGIDAEVGADPSDVGTMCLDLGGTSAADKNSVSNGDPGNFNDINLIQQFATSMNLPGYAAAATDDSAVQSFVAGRNNGDGTPTVSAIHDTTTGDGNPAGSGFTGTGTDCG